jgi:RimJ/RimL family protein N-acetyltransferase
MHVVQEAATYSTIEALRDGRRLEIRALRPEDRAALIAAVKRTSSQSLYRRFFAAKREFTEREVDFFVNVDFINHVALVAAVEDSGRPEIAGGGRYVVTQPGEAEVAFVVVDQYQGQGIGSALLRHLVTIARAAKLRQFVAEVLPENAAMLKVFERGGLPLTMRRESQAVHVTLDLR